MDGPRTLGRLERRRHFARLGRLAACWKTQPMLKIPELVVGTAARHGAVTVLPLFPAMPRPGVAYRLGTHALASGTLEIHELRGGGTVDQLEARNRGAERVLFVEGDHLLG